MVAWRWQGVEKVRKACVHKWPQRFPLREILLLFTFLSLRPTLFSSNPQPLKTSRRPPLIMTRLSNPIAVAQTQGSALNPLVSDCFSRVKWLCPPCHSLGHQHLPPGCLELLSREPSCTPGLLADLIHVRLAGSGLLLVTQGDWSSVVQVRLLKFGQYKDPSNNPVINQNQSQTNIRAVSVFLDQCERDTALLPSPHFTVATQWQNVNFDSLICNRRSNLQHFNIP